MASRYISEGFITIRKIEPTITVLKPRKRVAAYARISMESDRLNRSLSAQISYFSELIQRNPEWIYVDVYADSGISGGDIRRRAEFQRLIDDCNAGRIDVVLCKSISRFADTAQEFISTAVFGTSMSAHHILGLKQVPKVRLFAH